MRRAVVQQIHRSLGSPHLPDVLRNMFFSQMSHEFTQKIYPIPTLDLEQAVKLNKFKSILSEERN